MVFSFLDTFRRAVRCAAAAWLGAATWLPAAPVISEIMFHPSGAAEEQAGEWLEIHQPAGEGSADLSGWKISGGIRYLLPQGTVLPDGGYLIVAADPFNFSGRYPTYTGPVVGGWDGKLSNGGEALLLEDTSENPVDEVKYADEGDWALRVRPPLDPYGFQGWAWESAAAGGGHTFERQRAALPGTSGFNWRISAAEGGSPGSGMPDTIQGNLLTGIAETWHRPLIPRSTDPVTIYARVLEESGATSGPRTLFWRKDGDANFTAQPMTLAWREPRPLGSYRDETVSATLPAHANQTIIEYYVAVAGTGGTVLTYPAPARISSPGEVPAVFAQSANALLQVDNSFDPNRAWVPGDRPVYRIIMTAEERQQLRTLQSSGSLSRSDATMNATFISQDGSGVEARYLCSVRNRGFSSRTGPPNNFHVGFRSDEPWKDRNALQLNCRYPHSQVLTANVFALAGMPVQNARPVRLIMNGVSIAENGQRMFGTYAQVEPMNGQWMERHFPDDSEGNLYRADDHDANPVNFVPGDLGSGEFRYEGTNPLAYADTFFKRSNEEINDWTDLIQLCRVLSAPAAGGNPGQPAISDAGYPQRVQEVINLDQWLTHFALDALVGNQEGGLPTGRADDFALYRGIADPRFLLIPHDFDTCFDLNNDDNQNSPVARSIFSFHTNSSTIQGLQRLFTHPDLVQLYYQKIIHLTDHVFTPAQLNPMVDELLGGWVSAARIAEVKNYIVQRRLNVLSQIPQDYSLGSNLASGSANLPESADGAAIFQGTFAVAEASSMRLNGVPVTLNYRTLGSTTAGTWSHTVTAASGFLGRGITRVTAEFFDGPEGTGNRVHQLFMDVQVPEEDQFTSVAGTLSPVTVPHTLTLQTPSHYVPGIPVLVRVDARLPDGRADRGTWNRTAILTGPPGLIPTPDRIVLYNGIGSALVTFGSTTSGLVRTFVAAGGTSAAPVAGAPIWRFLDEGPVPAPDWKSSLTFDDSLWRAGPLQAGAGDGDERTIVNNVNTTANTRRAYFFRHTFNVEDPGNLTTLRFRAVVDDGAVFYLNGTEVFRDNVPAGEVGLTTSASSSRSGSAETTIRTYDISSFAHLIQPGPNLLAVQLQNFSTGNNDLGFDCLLEAVSPASDPGNFSLTATADGRSVTTTMTSLGALPPTVVSGILPPGETNWSGLIRLTGDVTVPAQGTLRLAPGTTVLVDGNPTPGDSSGTDLIIQGRLLSEGTAARPVVITCSDDSNRWGELLFSNSAVPSLLQHTQITRGGRSPGRGHTGKGPLVRLVSGQVIFEDCSLGDSPAKAIYTSGTGSLVLRRSLIARAITGPELGDGCALLIEDSNIQEILPEYRESDSPAPDDEDCLYVHNGTGLPVIVRRSVLARCGDDLFDGLGGPLTVEDCILRGGWDKGMSLLNNDLTITRTLIVDCDKAIVPKSSTNATRTVNASHLTIICEDHDTTLPPWGYGLAPSDPDPDTPSTGFYTQNKSGQSAAGAVLAINAVNCIVYAEEPVKVDPLYSSLNTVITWSCLVSASQPAAPPWPGTGNINGPLLLENQPARRLSPLFESPCRDAGDPSLPLDHDGSRADIGALPSLPQNLQSGEVHWTRAGSPWRVSENLTIPAGLTLRIHPGVHVQIAANRRITVRGRILAEGTAQQRILFTGIPGEVAEGDADPIKLGLQSGPPKWGGLRIIDSLQQENVISHVDFIDAQGTSPLGTENQGSVGFIRSWGLVESCTWAGTHLRMCYGRNAKLTIRNNVFPDMFIFDPQLNRIETPRDFIAAADNSQEPLKVEFPSTDAALVGNPAFTDGFPTGGFLRVYYNQFNGNRGHNDVMDADSGRWGAAGHFILDCRYNHFRGMAGDEHIDLGGDAYIASNIFERASKDDWNSDTGYSSAISSGDRGTGTTLMVARNYFYDLDHAVNLKSNTGVLFEHNTVAAFHPDYIWSGAGAGGEPREQLVLNAAVNVFVPEDGSAPTRGDGGYFGFNIFRSLPRIVSGADARISGGTLVNDVTTKLDFSGNLLHAVGTLELGPNHPGGVLDPAYLTDPAWANREGDPRLDGHYQPGPGSAAAGTGPGGFDLGATVPEWALLLSKPASTTPETTAVFRVGGAGIVAVKWRLNQGAWSASQLIGTGGSFPRNAPTRRHTEITLTNLPAGTHTFEVLGLDMAGNWQDADPAVIAGPQAEPTRWTWTIDPALLKVRLNEVHAAPPEGGSGFIELINHGARADLSQWSLSGNSGSPPFVFPAGTLLEPGALLLLPSDAAGHLIDPAGGHLFLKNDSGQTVDELEFGPQAQGYSLVRGPDGILWLPGLPTAGTANVAVPAGSPADVRISEWFAASRIFFGDDWVELFNASTLPVALGGLALSDNPGPGARRHPLPPNSYIAPGGYTVFTLDGTSRRDHLPFRLDAAGEALVLHWGDQRVDTVLFGPQTTDYSQNRIPGAAPGWSALPSRGFESTPGDAAWENARQIVLHLRITEIMFQPAGGSDFEYVELTNTGTLPLRLGGLAFVEGISMTFPGLTLGPGAQTTVVSDPVSFRQRYGPAVPVAGRFTGQLSNEGENVALALPMPFAGNVLRFRYEPHWQTAAAGTGRSLEIIPSNAAPSDYRDRLSWQASRINFGTPGGVHVPPPIHFSEWSSFFALPGGTAADEDGDGLGSLMEFSLGSNPLSAGAGNGADRAPAFAGEGTDGPLTVFLPVSGQAGGYGSQGVTYLLQESADLLTWSGLVVKRPEATGWEILTTPAAAVEVSPAGSGWVEVSFSLPPVTGAVRFVRLRVVLDSPD